MKKLIIQRANDLCRGNLMDYPDYDEDDPITSLAGALTIILGEDYDWVAENDIETNELFDFLETELHQD